MSPVGAKRPLINEVENDKKRQLSFQFWGMALPQAAPKIVRRDQAANSRELTFHNPSGGDYEDWLARVDVQEAPLDSDGAVAREDARDSAAFDGTADWTFQ